MKRLTMIFAATAIAATTGCSVSNDFTPVAGNTGEEIFSNACIDCHEPEDGYIFDISPAQANIETLSTIISKGKWAMPAFPNIQGAELTAISKFILANNKSEEAAETAEEETTEKNR